MTTHEQNMRMTRVGADQPAGKLLRQYWQPVALIEELDPARPVRAVKVLGQDFVLFRDEQGRYGLLDRDCPHRGADLAFGRAEDGGLRCPFHGWLFDVNGNCLQTPAEPENSRLCQRIKQKNYPVVLRSGILFAYLGPLDEKTGEPPAFPDFDCFVAPDSHVFAFKGHIACNWLQALEVGIDPAHASFLHRFFEDEDPNANYGRQFRATSADSDIPMTRVLREFDRPQIEVERTDYGMRLFALRQISDQSTHVRVTNLIFPQTFNIPLSAEMTITQWHVPIDDTNCYWYAIFTSFAGPVDKAKMRAQRLDLYTLPDYIPRQNKSNNYGFNVDEQKNQTYTGMGFDINVHDQWAVESQGPIQDRTREHLGSTDKAIINYRSMLMRAIDQVEGGKEKPLMVLDAQSAKAILGPVTVDGVAPTAQWQAYWRDADARKRQNASWSPPSPLAPTPQAAE
ncbi:Rieske 2Fe-2S domain-containing protein [Ferrovibrio sp.]|uniref:aromatic ring-hydroxylating dioxygenase subunit alpha n=1 Tax=Ferrovibrio sp. TaxID=1917215 RepID=UPI0035B462BB